MHPIQELIKNRTESRIGIYSCCSANEYVLRAAMKRAGDIDEFLLIEATANQVDQFGGYTGMKPEDFVRFVRRLAEQESFPEEKLILGGDHLGPLTFSNLPKEKAMQNAEELVRYYISAGFTKIHLDTSMKLLTDSNDHRLTDEVIAQRGARLCKACEEAFAKRQNQYPDALPPVYVIGSEVPIPGGAQEEEDSVQVTTGAAARATLDSFKSAFLALGLEQAWDRVVGLVVQPGVEFGDGAVFEYKRNAARELTAILQDNTKIVFEAHSTDYQTQKCLRELVEDGFAILKVGPALTFAFREALFALELIERELNQIRPFLPGVSDFRNVLEVEMLTDHSKWKNHYHGTDHELRFERAFSFSDRARYYFPEPNVTRAIDTLIENLSGRQIPLTLLSQYLPAQYKRVREKKIENRPLTLIKDRIGDCIDDYLTAAHRV